MLCAQHHPKWITGLERREEGFLQALGWLHLFWLFYSSVKSYK